MTIRKSIEQVAEDYKYLNTTCGGISAEGIPLLVLTATLRDFMADLAELSINLNIHKKGL